MEISFYDAKNVRVSPIHDGNARRGNFQWVEITVTEKDGSQHSVTIFGPAEALAPFAAMAEPA